MDETEKKSAARLREARFSEIAHPAVPHAECKTQYCDPQNEQTLIRRGKLAGPALTTHVYLCKLGQLHVCHAAECCALGPCPVSGMHQGPEYVTASYDKHDSRTWESHMPLTAAKRVSTKESVQSKIETLVSNLLYSHAVRQSVAASMSSATAALARRRRAHYLQQCEQTRTPVNLATLASLTPMVATTMNTIRYDPEVVARYTDRVLRFAEQCNVSDKSSVEALTLAVLYKMQQGMNEALPLDPFLVRHLPPVNELARFKVDKRKLKKGEKMLMALFNKASYLPSCFFLVFLLKASFPRASL